MKDKTSAGGVFAAAGGMTISAEDAAKMYESFQRAGMLESGAAQAVDAMIEAERQAEHERRRKARYSAEPLIGGDEPVLEDAAHEALRERVTVLESDHDAMMRSIMGITDRLRKLEESLAYAQAENQRLSERVKRLEEDKAEELTAWGSYLQPADGRAFEAAVKAEDARHQEMIRIETERLDTQIMAGYSGADAQGPRLIKEIMSK
jgi:hypothetical protein